MKTIQLNVTGLFTGGVMAILVTGCGASVTTRELVDARSLMAQARAGDTARRNPDQLRVAQRALTSAEAAHDDDPGSPVERDRAYIAERRIRIAMANARRGEAAENARTQQAQYTHQLEQTAQSQDTQIANTRTELDRSRNQTAASTQQLDATTATLRTRDQELATEHEAHAATQTQLELTTADLNDVASVRQQQEDLIITLTGAVLFGTGQTMLLPDAERRLTAVATVIRARPDRRVTVVGYTDSNGSATRNEALSLARATIVRDRLALGVPAARIEAEGRGEAAPVGDNRSAEGRASNRRVEIVLHREGPVAAR